MNHDYPHIRDTEFPDLQSVDVYKYENDYDYGSYTDSVRIKMLNVSWCGDYDNTVYFESKKIRDEWFDSQQGLVRDMSTMFRLYADGNIKVDAPIDECMDYNYVMIDYGKLPNQGALSDNHRMFYFIDGMSQESVNATRLSLSVDWWTTFIHDIDIEYVNLLRGHAPMADTTVDEYLSNPLDNSEYLLTADVDYGYIQRAASSESIIFNDDDVTLGFLTNGSMEENWDNRIPAYAFEYSQAFSAVDIFTLDTVDDWEDFRTNVTETYPQFWKTVKGMFLVSKKLVTFSNYQTGGYFMFCGVKCHHLETNGDKVQGMFELTKDKFGYADNISSIAKLYTYPYAAVEVNDFKGNTSLIRIEDTTGKLELHTVMCDMYPFLNIEAYMLGIGGNASTTISFKNSYDNTFKIGGRYYNFSTKWSIPVFAVQLTAEDNWALNGKIEADASLTCTYNAADTMRANQTLSNDWASDKRGLNNAFLDDTLYQNKDKLIGDLGYDVTLMDTVSSIEQDASMSSAVANATAGIATAAVTVAAVGITGGLAAPAAGAAGAGASAVASGAGAMAAITAVGGAGVNALSQQASYGIFVSKNSGTVQASKNCATFKTTLACSQMDAITGITKTYNTDVTDGDISLASSVTDNNVSLSKGNATTAYNAQHAQKLLDNPPEFGQLTGTPDIISKPFGLTYNVVTQSKNAIRQAAEQFLRYGYMLNMEWKVGSFNLMPKFTYWKCDVVYCNDNGVFEGAQDMIKSILNKGTTVWRVPEEIGVTSIYENI